MSAEINYYILFANYTHGLAMQELLKKEGLLSRIAPTPRAIQKELSCGMSLLIKSEHIEAVKSCIQEHEAQYYDIVAMPCQIQPRRDKFC